MDSACAPEMNESSNTLFSDESTFLTELAVLREICEEDIVVNDKPNASEVSISLHPATAGNKDAQYVCLTLIIQVTLERCLASEQVRTNLIGLLETLSTARSHRRDRPQPDTRPTKRLHYCEWQYPDVPASFQFRNPRGMSEDELERITKDLKKLAEEKRGCEMMYDLIQAAKDSLTENNSPSLPCTICQCLFEENDVFTKTACYHYFHSFCLAQYLKFTDENEEEEPKCPVCRKALEGTLLAELQDAPEPCYSDCPDSKITAETRQWQQEMRVEFERQKAKGGHIDIEAENKRHLISIRHVPSTSIEDMVSQQLRNASLASTDGKIPQDPSKAGAEHTHRKHKDGAPVFVHSKHHNRHGGHDSNHRRSRGHGEGRGHHNHRSHPKHSGWRDERSGSSGGHQRSDQRWSGDRDRHKERRGKDGQKAGERKQETDKSRVQSQPARDKESEEPKIERLEDNDKCVKQEKEERSDQPSGLSLSAIDTKGVETKEVKDNNDNDKDNDKGINGRVGVKKSEKVEEGEVVKKLNGGTMHTERPGTGRRTPVKESHGGKEMKGINDREHREKYQPRNDIKRHDRGQQPNNRRPARSERSEIGSQRDDNQERRNNLNPKSSNDERGGRGRGGGRGGRGLGRGGTRGGMGRSGSQGGVGRGRKGDGSKEERTGESSVKAGSSRERAEESKVRPPPGFDKQPMVKAQPIKPPPGFDFR